MDKLESWDVSQADSPQYMMNMAKKHVIMAALEEGGGEATFEQLFARADELHCDVLTAALHSMKRKKAVGYDKEMPLLHPVDNAGVLRRPPHGPFRAPTLGPRACTVVVKLLKPDFDCFA